MKINASLGQIERLSRLGCRVVIKDGEAHASIAALAVARFNAAIHALRVRSLRVYWKRMRNLDRGSWGAGAFWESYICLKYQTRETLPSRWFNLA